MRLLLNGIIKFICGFLLVSLLVFLPAGTLEYPGGWLFCALLFVPVLIMGAVLYIKAPALLEKRLDVKEKQTAQKGVVALSGIGFIVGFVISALDFRFGCSLGGEIGHGSAEDATIGSLECLSSGGMHLGT